MTATAVEVLLKGAAKAPWRLSMTDDTCVIDADGNIVAETDGDYNDPDLWPIMEANARLIAAAPELAALLIHALGVLEQINADWDGEPEDMFAARAVLARAEKIGGGV